MTADPLAFGPASSTIDVLSLSLSPPDPSLVNFGGMINSRLFWNGPDYSEVTLSYQDAQFVHLVWERSQKHPSGLKFSVS
jgi:hypothetical protein